MRSGLWAVDVVYGRGSIVLADVAVFVYILDFRPLLLETWSHVAPMRLWHWDDPTPYFAHPHALLTRDTCDVIAPNASSQEMEHWSAIILGVHLKCWCPQWSELSQSNARPLRVLEADVWLLFQQRSPLWSFHLHALRRHLANTMETGTPMRTGTVCGMHRTMETHESLRAHIAV